MPVAHLFRRLTGFALIMAASIVHATDQPTKSRGQLLYENHCVACHESMLHIRDQRKAQSLADINQWVSRWVTYQKLAWSEDELQQVVQYLNQTYYHYQK